MTRRPESVDQIAQTILGYIAACPDACDNLNGVCEWWIAQQRLVEARADVLAALELLRSRGQIDTRTGADGQVLYRASGTPPLH